MGPGSERSIPDSISHFLGHHVSLPKLSTSVPLSLFLYPLGYTTTLHPLSLQIF